jgi:hypothetical protein
LFEDRETYCALIIDVRMIDWSDEFEIGRSKWICYRKRKLYIELTALQSAIVGDGTYLVGRICWADNRACPFEEIVIGLGTFGK